MGYRSSCDTEVHGIQNFRGHRNSWDTEVHMIQKYMGIQSSWDTEVQKFLEIYTVGIDMMLFETRLQTVRAILNVSLAWLNPRQDHKTPSHHLAVIFVNRHNFHGEKKFSLVNPQHMFD